MPKKIFDIIPPKETKQSLSPVSISARNQKNIILKRKPKHGFKIKKGFYTTLIISFSFLIIVVISGFFFFSKTKIEIWPETETFFLKRTITIDLDQNQSDPSLWIETGSIPGEIFEDQKSNTQRFAGSGKTLKQEKARGVIRVYNAYSTQAQALLPNTRFVSADGKLFRSVKKEVIPGGRYEGGKLVPGEIDIEVQAAEPGENYNIGPSTFSIPGFAGTPRYTSFYGKSFSPMTNGFKDEVSQVVQGDLDRGGRALTEKIKIESKSFLKTALPENFILLDEATFQEVIEENYSVEAGAVADSFNVQVKVRTTALIFKKSDLEDFVKTLINLNISEDKKFQEESLEISYSFDSLVSEESDNLDIESSKPFSFDEKTGGKMIMNLEIKAKVYSDIDLIELKRALAGKSFQEVEMFLKDHPQIVKTQINRGFFWRKKVPEDMNKVEINLNLD